MSYSSPRFEIDQDAVQQIAPGGKKERFEGVAFSPSGRTLAIATADANTILLFRRQADGRFEDAPYRRIGGVDYPHDVSFSRCGDTELLAVAQRAGALAIYAKSGEDESYGAEPACQIGGPDAKLEFSDGVAFVPPHDDYLAACNLTLATISFYRRASLSPLRFGVSPEFQLRHPSISNPDGLAFSGCGKWLAVANHGNNSVSIFRRRNKLLSGGKLRYGPEPVTVIEDASLRFPHSVAFSPVLHHLIVTNAGANYFNAYEPTAHGFGLRWSQSPVKQCALGPLQAFQAVNSENKMEGGGKGVAIHNGNIAVCSPENGLKIFSLHERL